MQVLKNFIHIVFTFETCLKLKQAQKLHKIFISEKHKHGTFKMIIVELMLVTTFERFSINIQIFLEFIPGLTAIVLDLHQINDERANIRNFLI